MADIADRERLQPSLLDRLIDDHPTERRESRDQRFITQQRLRDLVLRDLSWLLNSCSLETVMDLDDYPEVKTSTLNYGIIDLTGKTAAGIIGDDLEGLVRQAIFNFEPRILPQSLDLRLASDALRMDEHTLAFEIEGALWGQPVPSQVYLRTEIDLEIGEVRVSDSHGRAS